MFLACKNDFKAIEVEISRLPNDEIVNTEQVRSLIREYEMSAHKENQKKANTFDRELHRLKEEKKRIYRKLYQRELKI